VPSGLFEPILGRGGSSQKAGENPAIENGQLNFEEE
jgi:hypothetical protein